MNVALVVSNKPDAYVLVRAANLHVPYLTLTREELARGEELARLMKERGIDFIVLAGFLLRVPEALIEAYPGRIVNIHPALLPKYGGKGMYGDRVHRAVVETGFSRFPVADSNGTWLGYVHVKDALDDFLADRDVAVPIRPLITVTSTQNFDLAMRAMRVNSSHVAAVVENGRTIGLVMLEDIIEELVGTVRDWTHD